MNKIETGDTIPVLDLSNFLLGNEDVLNTLAAELRYALEEVGFFYIVGHGVSEKTVARAFDVTRDFHALPLEAKTEILINQMNLGYMPDRGQKVTTSTVSDGDKPDRGSAFFMIRDRAPGMTETPNQWPAAMPQFRDVLVPYFEQMIRLGRSMLPIFARALELKDNYFDPYFSEYEALCFQRASHYPADALENGQYSCGPHTDGSFITLLATTDVPGLEIQTADENWIAAPLWQGSFLVNSGDMLTRWTNGRFRSTPHRVINDSGKDRYAIPFFMQPNPDTLIDCLPTCHDETHPPKEEPITCAAYLKWYLENNFLHYDS
ncbi:MAG: isopenicillin N synthase family dioxygenase [Gammaproteobacteria bacterium]